MKRLQAFINNCLACNVERLKSVSVSLLQQFAPYFRHSILKTYKQGKTTFNDLTTSKKAMEILLWSLNENNEGKKTAESIKNEAFYVTPIYVYTEAKSFSLSFDGVPYK